MFGSDGGVVLRTGFELPGTLFAALLWGVQSKFQDYLQEPTSLGLSKIALRETYESLRLL